MLQNDSMRILQPDTTHDASRLLADTAHLLAEIRPMMPDESRILVNDPRLVVNVVEPTRLLVQDSGRTLLNDGRDVTIDNRILNNSADNRHLAIGDGTRILTDKYLTYSSYNGGHL